MLILAIVYFPLAAEVESVKLKLHKFDKNSSSTVKSKLSGIEGIENVKINKKGAANLKPLEHSIIDLAALQDAVESETSYKVKNFKLTATGKIKKHENYYVFGVNNCTNKIFLTDIKSINPDDDKKMNVIFRKTLNAYNKTTAFVKNLWNNEDTMRKSIRLHYKHNAPVRMSGFIKAKSDGTYWLAIDSAKIKEIDTDLDYEEKIIEHLA